MLTASRWPKGDGELRQVHYGGSLTRAGSAGTRAARPAPGVLFETTADERSATLPARGEPRRAPSEPRPGEPRAPMPCPALDPALDPALAAALERALACAPWEQLAPRGWYARWGQRALDLTLCAALAPLAAPLVGLLFVLNSAQQHGDPRLAFFRQRRLGSRGLPFELVKLRTLRETGVPHFRSWAEGRDAERVTPLGVWLRRTHLDELPNLWNVVRGQMSMVGPRPEMIEVEAWAAVSARRFVERLAVRPGVTGLAQALQGYTGCNAREYRHKRALNVLYRRKQSLFFDLRVLALTAAHLAGVGAILGARLGARPRPGVGPRSPAGRGRVGRPTEHRAELGV